MNITEYLSKLNKESQTIFTQTVKETTLFGKAHHRASCFHDFAEVLFDKDESAMLRTASAQIESALLSLSLGLYRQAYASLRLSFELGLGTVYFSVNKMEHFEWLAGKTDITWGKLIDADNGILSHRFCIAFFPELKDQINDFHTQAKKVYRAMSEFVHGNFETWSDSGLELKRNKDLEQEFFNLLQNTTEVVLFVLIVRYLKTLDRRTIEGMEFVSEELGHIEEIRTFFGGPKN